MFGQTQRSLLVKPALGYPGTSCAVTPDRCFAHIPGHEKLPTTCSLTPKYYFAGGHCLTIRRVFFLGGWDVRCTALVECGDMCCDSDFCRGCRAGPCRFEEGEGGSGAKDQGNGGGKGGNLDSCYKGFQLVTTMIESIPTCVELSWYISHYLVCGFVCFQVLL